MQYFYKRTIKLFVMAIVILGLVGCSLYIR